MHDPYFLLLREISPAIWRRLLVRSDSTVADLHYTIQIAMGWTDLHLHQFIIHGKYYGVSKIGGIWFAAERMLEIVESKDLEECRYDYREEVAELLYWLKSDKFPRRNVNRHQLSQKCPICP